MIAKDLDPVSGRSRVLSREEHSIGTCWSSADRGGRTQDRRRQVLCPQVYGAHSTHSFSHAVEMFLCARRALEFSHDQDLKRTSKRRSPHGHATGTPRASISLSSSLFRLRGHVNCAEWAEACLRGCPPCQRMRRTGPRSESPTARPVPCHRHQSLAASRLECHRPR